MSKSSLVVDFTSNSIARVYKGKQPCTLPGVLWSHPKQKIKLMAIMPERETTMTKIIIDEKSTINAEGVLNTKGCKPVVCLNNGNVYTSATDAAKANGLHVDCMSRNCLGKIKESRIEKLRFCYLKDINEHLDELTANLRKLSTENGNLKAENLTLKANTSQYSAEDIAKWKSAYDAQEAKRKAKEKRERIEAERAQLAREREEIEARINALAMEMEASDAEFRELYKGDVA